MMYKPRRQHPATILFNFLKLLKDWIIYIIIGLFTFKNEGLLYFSLIFIVLITILFIFSFLRWYRFTYQIEEEEFLIEYGVFIRKRRYISKNRIQSIDLSANPIHQVFKLVKVQIETAGSGTDAEAFLQAVTLNEGKLIREQFKGTNVVQEEVLEKGLMDISKEISNKDLLIAGATSGSTGVILALLGAGFSEFEQFVPEHFYDNTIEWIIGLSVVFIVLLVIVAAVFIWMLGIIGTVIKYWKFTITKTDKELFITRGLLEKKQITIPLKRIQAVGIKESIIRQPLGYVTLFAEVAGSSLDKGEDFSTLLFPIMKKEEAKNFLNQFLPDYAFMIEEFTPVPRRGLKYYIFRGSILFVIISTIILFVVPGYSWFSILFLLGSLYLSYLRYKETGFSVKGEQIIINYRKLSKMTILLYKKRIQSMEKKQHLFHQKEQLATVRMSIIARQGTANYKLKELDEEKANHLSDWYSYRK